MKRWRWIVAATGLSLVVLLAIGISINMFSSKPDGLGVTNGNLAPCPDSPNCVSTQATDAEHSIEPIAFAGTTTEAMAAIKAALQTLPRTEIKTETDNYLHAESTSLIMRYVDDVEFYFDVDAQLIHFRSASRIGHSDLGVNRKRMETFRQAFQANQ